MIIPTGYSRYARDGRDPDAIASRYRAGVRDIERDTGGEDEGRPLAELVAPLSALAMPASSRLNDRGVERSAKRRRLTQRQTSVGAFGWTKRERGE